MKTIIIFIIQVLLISSVYSQELTWNINEDKTINVDSLPVKIMLNGFEGDTSISFFSENTGLKTTINVSDSSIIEIQTGPEKYVKYDTSPYKLFIAAGQGAIFCGEKKLTLNFDKTKTNIETKSALPQNKLIKLPVIDCRYGDGESIKEKYKNKIGKGNKLLVIDASPFVSAQSGIYHESKEGLSKCSFLSYRDFVKVYIENLNPYLYDVKVATAETDIGTKPIENDSVIKASLETAEVGNGSDSLIMLLNYSKATKYLLEFIECVKTNPNPSSDVLESHKDVIRNTLINSDITPDKNIQKIYNGLTDTLQQKYKAEYELAKQFSSVYNEFESLSYTIESTLLPIRVKSYDKLSITITLKDKKSKNIVQEQEYEFLIRGGWNIDQSFGIVAHGLTDKIYSLNDSMGLDPIYFVLPNGFKTDSITAYTPALFRKIIEEEKPPAAFGLSTLTNIYYRLTPWLNFGPGLGVSADIYPNTNVRYLTGGTLLFKDGRNKISLNIGCAWGQYKDFGHGQKDGIELKGENTIPNMIDKYGSSLYIGVSYQNQIFNFDNTQKENKEIGN